MNYENMAKDDNFNQDQMQGKYNHQIPQQVDIMNRLKNIIAANPDHPIIEAS